jgi:hypothetical protein
MTRTWQEEEEEKSLDKAHIPRFHRMRDFTAYYMGRKTARVDSLSSILGFLRIHT